MLVPGVLLVAGSLVLYAVLMNADTPIWVYLIPSAIMGLGSAGMWGPLATTANRDLPVRLAGAGSSIYNTTRTVGSVIGSASIAALMQSRLEAHFPGAGEASSAFGSGQLPAFLIDGFSAAMAESMILPAAILIVGLVAVLFMQRPKALSKQ
jgi:MFS family permease